MNNYYKARELLIEYLEKDLVGPSCEDEQLILEDSRVSEHYISGILYPRSSKNEYAEDHLDEWQGSDNSAGDEASADIPTAMANSMYPSSIGLTFSVDCSNPVTLRIRVETAKYTHVKTQDNQKSQWNRVPVCPDDVDLVIPSDVGTKYKELGEDLSLFYNVRPPDSNNVSTVTLSLINNSTTDRFDERDLKSFFQPKITATSVNPGEGIFVERPGKSSGTNHDALSATLLYRYAKVFAIGHGCSGWWTLEKENSERAVEVSTEIIPKSEVPSIESNGDIQSKALSMRYLADGNKPEIIAELLSFVAGYELWIKQKTDAGLKTVESDLHETVSRHIENLSRASERMTNGVRLLEEHTEVWQAFQLCNSAMFTVRNRDSWIKTGKKTDSPEENSDHHWYPFQLAFVLLCIEGIAFRETADRDILDLLWFPTGGGKTEAYFGVLALAIFLRRIRLKDFGGGTTGFMRYSLRLLTVQQFQRAALLICACEDIRSQRSDLGKDPISLGLYVGGGLTPNSHETNNNYKYKSIGTEEALKTLTDAQAADAYTGPSPVQLTKCPWCGTPMGPLQYNVVQVSKNSKELEIVCKSDRCLFGTKGNGAKLPIFVVDEDIYRSRPTLLIATVDKFAQVAWNPRLGEIFNIGYSDPPPELIIQDELHLMSGPLGTLTGLYETAVDLLCDNAGYKPKIIASTATIRSASAQSKNLFARDSFQFPPPGIDARDSYFAREVSKETKGNRMYVGLFAPGTSATTLMVRTYGALLQGAKDLTRRDDIDDDVKDAYWTLVGYFNTRRLLGSALLQVTDDVRQRIGYLSREYSQYERLNAQPVELSGRSGAAELNTTLSRLGKGYQDDDVIDVILATNMISVGVDINRWGLMVVMGQPMSTSEYIQATSRVGRDYPGLSTIIFNHTKSRDRSHYEAFKAYHSALYKQVESTSVTPFSPRAREKALHAVLVACMRLLHKEFKDDPNAIDNVENKYLVCQMKNRIMERVSIISPHEASEISNELDFIIGEWSRHAADNKLSGYRGNSSRSQNDHKFPLMAIAGEEHIHKEEEKCDCESWSTMMSLRDVDTECELYISDSN